MRRLTDGERELLAELNAEAAPAGCPLCERAGVCEECAAWDARWAAEMERINAEAADQVRVAALEERCQRENQQPIWVNDGGEWVPF